MNKKIKYKNLSDNISIALIFYFFSLILEFVTAMAIWGTIPRMIWVSIGIIHIITVIIFLLPTRALRAIVAVILLLVQCILGIANEITYRTTGEIVTFDKLALTSETLGAGGVTSFSLFRMDMLCLFVALFIVILLFIIFTRKFIKKYQATLKQFIAILLFNLLAIIFTFSMCMVSSSDYLYDYELFTSQFPVTTTHKNYGHYSFYTVNLINYLRSALNLGAKGAEECLTYIDEGWTDTTNEYTGISADNNVILILAESLDSVVIDEYFTPNLYDLMYNNDNAMYMSNYYAENKTNMSEGLAIMGTYSRAKQLAYVGNDHLTSILNNVALPSLLKAQDADIATSYYHGLTSEFYKREKTFGKLGYDNLIFADNQEQDIKSYNKENDSEYYWTTNVFYDFIKDSNFVDYNINKFIPNEGRFFTTFATLTTHGTYTPRGSNMEYYNTLMNSQNKVYYNKMISDLENAGYYPQNILSSFLYYKAAAMDLDKTIGIIFDRLQATGNLDNTTILMYADHNAYYDQLSYVIRGIKAEQANNCHVNAYNMPCFIYDKDLVAEYKVKNSITTNGTIHNDTFMSVMDIYPTLCNVLGLTYNTNLTYGVSIFDDIPHVFMTFKDSCYIFDDKNYYYDNKVYAVDEENDSTYFKPLVDKIIEKFNYQEKLYKNLNVFERVFQKDAT